MAKKKMREAVSVEVNTISLEKTIVQRAYEYSLKRGYQVSLEGGILLFPYTNDNERITKDLINQFGYERKEEIEGVMRTVKRLPFSYGFTDPKKFTGKNEISGVEREEEENEDAET